MASNVKSKDALTFQFTLKPSHLPPGNESRKKSRSSKEKRKKEKNKGKRKREREREREKNKRVMGQILIQISCQGALTLQNIE